MSLGEYAMKRALSDYGVKPFDMPEAWAEFIAYRERLGLGFCFQTAQECIEAFHEFEMTHLQHLDDEQPYEGASPVVLCHCGLPWPLCGHALNDFARAYET